MYFTKSHWIDVWTTISLMELRIQNQLNVQIFKNFFLYFYRSGTSRFQIHFVTKYIVYQCSLLSQCLAYYIAVLEENTWNAHSHSPLILQWLYITFNSKLNKKKYLRIIWKHKPKAWVFLVEECDGNFQCHVFDSKSKIHIHK